MALSMLNKLTNCFYFQDYKRYVDLLLGFVRSKTYSDLTYMVSNSLYIGT